MAITPKSNVRVPRRSIAGMEAMWTKMWDPPRASPTTPELVGSTNPVPAFMASLGLGNLATPGVVQRDLKSSLMIPTWDGLKDLEFMVIGDADFFPGGAWPGPTIRVPQGWVFHCQTDAKAPPHTIHWHGLEPTPMNDGVGHCSMELGSYLYQFQPNFIGTYFYHCHRNTVQHFEFGLYGMFLVEPRDAFDPSNPNRGGYPRRTAANLAQFSRFADKFVGGDPTWGMAGPSDADLSYPAAHPHDFTVEYDVEALWVFDDRDSVWSDLASNVKAFYPGGSNTGAGHVPLLTPTQPGADDQFPHGWFNDFNADYWFVTGVPVPAHPVARGGTGQAVIDASLVPAGILDANGHIVPALNSGVSGMQVPVDAQVDQTVLVRVLNGAYNVVEVEFPVDVTIIAFDGRALGVPPFGRYNHAFTLPKNTPYRLSVARRFDALIRESTPFSGFGTVRFYDSRGIGAISPDPLLMTAKIPINIHA
jgi:hypothetical protein